MTSKVYNQDMARQFAHDEKHIADIIYSIEWEKFFIRKGNYYEQQDDKAFRKYVQDYIIKSFPNQNHTMSTYKDVVEQLKGLTVRQYESVNTEYIALNDCLLNTDTLELEANDHEKIAIHHIPVSSQDLEKETPSFTNYLNTTIVKEEDTGQPDEELISLVQEMFGFYITPNLKAEGMFFLVGRGSNGKSVMINIIEKLIGSKYTSAMSIQYLTTNNFATYGLIGKKLNVCNEEESKHLRADKFKALVTGDTIQVERKNQDSFSYRPTTKYLFATQNIPNFQDVDNGIMRRIKIIMFNRIFKPSEKNKDIIKDIEKEMGGVLKFAIEGARRLKENNYNFSNPKQLVKALDEFEQELSSPIRYFKEHYVVHPNGKDNPIFKTKKEMFLEYSQWCDEVNKGKKSKTNFFKDIENQIPNFVENQARLRIGGKPEYGVFVSLIEDEFKDDIFDGDSSDIGSIINSMDYKF